MTRVRTNIKYIYVERNSVFVFYSVKFSQNSFPDLSCVNPQNIKTLIFYVRCGEAEK